MRVFLDCLPCFLRQALEAARRVTDDERSQRAVLDAVAALMPNLPLDATPIDLGRQVHRVVRQVTGVDDPYREAKRRDNDRVLALLPQLRRRIASSSDPLRTALMLAAAGNAIDLAISSRVDLELAIERGLENDEGMVDYPSFRAALLRGGDLLYLGDNAGEIVFDRLVVEQLVAMGVRVTFAVRGRPIINDATLEDAREVGMDRLAEVVSSGSDGPGTALGACDPEFVELFGRSRLILAKGQGNFEGLSDERAPLFFLLMVKCPVVARELRAPIGRTLLRAQPGGKDPEDLRPAETEGLRLAVGKKEI
jgi:damage-control phosphatase, subfamily I